MGSQVRRPLNSRAQPRQKPVHTTRRLSLKDPGQSESRAEKLLGRGMVCPTSSREEPDVGWEARGIQHLCTFLRGVNPTCCSRVLSSGGHGADRSVRSAPTGFWAPDQAPMGLSRETSREASHFNKTQLWYQGLKQHFMEVSGTPPGSSRTMYGFMSSGARAYSKQTTRPGAVALTRASSSSSALGGCCLAWRCSSSCLFTVPD